VIFKMRNVRSNTALLRSFPGRKIQHHQVQGEADLEEAEALARKLKKQELTFEDKRFGRPLKAREADRYLFSVETLTSRLIDID